MTTETKPKRGGKRPGAGRPLKPDGRTGIVAVRVEPHLAAFVRRQGGSRWLYALIQRAERALTDSGEESPCQQASCPILLACVSKCRHR